MKVALLSDCYPPRVGGIESQVSDLAAQLVGAGHEVAVLTATAGAGTLTKGAVEEVPVPGGPVLVHRLSHPAMLGVPIQPWAAPELRRRLVAGGYDVAHVHMGVVSPFAWDATRVATTLGLPTVVTWHCVLDRAAPPWRWSGAPARWVRRGAVLSAVSGYAAEGVRAAAPGAPVAVLPNGIDVSWWAPAGGVPGGRRGSSLTVVSTLRLAPRKRPGVLLDVVGEVRRRTGVDVRLEVYGDGPLRSRLGRRVAREGLDWARLVGRVPRASLPERHAAADVYLAPTRLEAFGIAALEARTAGLPVVARSDSGTRDVVEHEVSGLLAADDAGLIDALERLVREPDLRARIAARSAAVPPEQAWPRVVAAVEAEYRRALRRPPLDVRDPGPARRRARGH